MMGQAFVDVHNTLAGMHGYAPLWRSSYAEWEASEPVRRRCALWTAFMHIRWEVWHRRAEPEWGGYG